MPSECSTACERAAMPRLAPPRPARAGVPGETTMSRPYTTAQTVRPVSARVGRAQPTTSGTVVTRLSVSSGDPEPASQWFWNPSGARLARPRRRDAADREPAVVPGCRCCPRRCRTFLRGEASHRAVPPAPRLAQRLPGSTRPRASSSARSSSASSLSVNARIADLKALRGMARI